MSLLRRVCTAPVLKQLTPALQGAARPFASGATPPPTAAEVDIQKKLLENLPAVQAEVQDTSGGCGTMYQINVVSEAFSGLSVVKQHQLVTKVLKEEIPQWHGFVLNTSAPQK